jgi:hypothetical protein
MARDLRRLRLDFDEVDIEQDAALEATYSEAIPVLLAGRQEVARAPQSQASLRDALRRRGLL